MTPRRIAAWLYFLGRIELREQRRHVVGVALASRSDSKDIKNQIEAWDREL
jgi:hypothetical protein